MLYVPGIKRNLVSTSALEDKGYKVAFSDGKVLAWNKNSSMNSSCVIGFQEEILYRLTTQPAHTLVHDSTSLGELCHKRLAHLHYRALPSSRNMVTILLVLYVDHDGICRGCALGKNAKESFLSSDSRAKGI